VPVPVSEPEPEPEPRPVSPLIADHVRQFRLEIATAEAVEFEELLQVSISAEQEAQTRTALIRERLREALNTIAELSAPETRPPTLDADAPDVPGA